MPGLKKYNYADEISGLPVEVREHHRARRVLIRLVPGRGIRITIPMGFNPRYLPDVVNEKRQWIEKTRQKMEKQGIEFSGTPELPREIFFRATESRIRVDLCAGGEPRLLPEESRILLQGTEGADKAVILDLLCGFVRDRARQELVPRLLQTAREVGFYPHGVRVGMQKTRWGSCSEKKNISLNAKLMFLPYRLVDQLFVHELCHLARPDHSARFWDMVASFRPDYREAESELGRAFSYLPGWV
jgi:hypothetical protein